MSRRISSLAFLLVALSACDDTTSDESDGGTQSDGGEESDAGTQSDSGFDAGTESDGCVGSCVAPTCTDGMQNGSETGVDCGGSCGACPPPPECTLGSECASTHCVDHVCVTGPTAGFTLTTTSGDAPLATSATSTAVAGSVAITTTTYDWDDGAGFVGATSHSYSAAGSFTITQRVVDANGIAATTAVDVDVTEFVPVRWNPADASLGMTFSPDRLSVESGHERGGVRSNRSIAAGSGVFYVEAQRLQSPSFLYGVGVGTAAANKLASIGSTPESVGVITSGGIDATGSSCVRPSAFFPAADQDHYGFVVDYRGASPIVHVLLDDGTGAPFVQQTCTMATTSPLFVFYEGERSELREQLRINPGNDTTNRPFHFAGSAIRAALTAASAQSAGEALILGWGQTRARAVNSVPVLTTSGDLSVTVGTLVSLTASATDAEDGSLTATLDWQDLAQPHFALEVGEGAAYSFTPTSIGRHPIVVRAIDSFDAVTTHTILVNVTGTLAQSDPVLLVDDEGTGAGITIAADGLGARFDGWGKEGVRANQAIYGRFWYFEATRHVAPTNMGVGLVVRDGSLDPYDFANVPYSCSVNATGSTWQNLVWQANVPTSTTYGFAVDYRGVHPIVYVISDDVVQDVLVLGDVWMPIHPMVYANPTGSEAPALDWSVNFGATGFASDAVAALAAANVDTTGFELGWGEANLP